VPDTRSGTPLGQSSQSGIRLTGAGDDDAGADPCPVDVPPPAVGAAAARALGTVLRLPAEVLPGAAEREMGELEPSDPTIPVFVAVGEDAAPRGVTVVGAGAVAAEPVDEVVPAAPL
jgi:hypothetical protein